MAISHALAQSTKLSIYEERVVALVEESRHLPQDLANHGRVSMPTRKLAQLIGKVFLQSSNVNLLSTVLDTPDYFWSAPDHLQVGHTVCYKCMAYGGCQIARACMCWTVCL